MAQVCRLDMRTAEQLQGAGCVEPMLLDAMGLQNVLQKCCHLSLPQEMPTI